VDSGNYTGSTEAVINVSRGNLSDFISGGGHIVSTLSAGLYASDPLKKTHFGFNIKHNQACQNIQGKMNVVFRRTQSGMVHVYQLKGNTFNSLSVTSTTAVKNASFTCKVTLKDVTNPRNQVTLGSNLSLQVIITDRGSPGTNDSIGFTLWSSSNVLLYSRNWISARTVAKNLTSGNIIIRRGNADRLIEQPAEQDSELDVTAMPNPATNYFTLVVRSSNDDQIGIRVVDLSGKIIEVQTNIHTGESVKIGNEYEPGMYFVQVWQGELRKTIKILKR
jgi:hypothetical protein